jgi:CRP/FNR family transcriptional regulator
MAAELPKKKNANEVPCAHCRCIVRCIDSSIRNSFSSQVWTRSYAKGTIVFDQGEPVRGVAIFCNGKAKEVWRGVNGDKKILELLGPGEAAGLADCLAQERYHTCVKVLESAQVAWIDLPAFRALLADAKAAQWILQRLAQEKVRLQQDQVSYARLGVKQLLARLLLQLAEKWGRLHEQGILIDVRLTKQELAEMLGYSPGPIYHCLAELERRKTLAYDQRRILLRDVRQLENLACWEDGKRKTLLK